MGFNANSVPKLDWDFSTWLDTAARGVTPEPSQKVITQFLESLRGLAEEVGGTDNLGDPSAASQAIAQRFAGMPEDEVRAKTDELNDELLASIADLTQGCPSRDQLGKLQETAPRVFKAYTGWLYGSLNPEG